MTLFVVGAILDIGAGWAAEGQEPAPSTLRKLLPAVWICTGAGGALLAGAILYPADPVDATERQRLMHDYNASGVSDAEPVDHPSPRRQPVAVSFAPLAARASDALVLGGQLRLSF